MSSLCAQLIKEGRKKLLQLTLEQQSEVLRIYEGAIDELAARAAAAKDETLTKRWLDDYLEKGLRPAQRELAKRLRTSISGGIQAAGDVASNFDLQLFALAMDKAAIDLGPHFTEMFSAVPRDVLEAILKGDLYRDGRGLTERVWKTSRSFGNDIGYIIKRGLVEKKGAVALAKDLEQFLKPEARRPWSWGKVYPNLRTKQVDYSAQRLARTSITHAYRESQYRSAERNPFVDAIHWHLSEQHYERQVRLWGRDECDDYAEQNDYGLGVGNYPKGEVPLSHPMCLCTTMPVVSKSLDSIADELRAWMHGGDNPVLDEWYKQYGDHFAARSA